MKKKSIPILMLCLFACSFCNGEIKSKKKDLPGVLGAIVRSDKWIIKRNPPREEFIGNVSYKNPYYEIKTDWALFERTSGVFSAKGNVWGKKIWLDGSQTQVFCHSATYNRKTQVASAYPRNREFVEATHFEPLYGTWQSKSKKATFDEKSKRVDLTGQVEISGKHGNAIADKISYHYESDGFEFSGDPVIWGVYEGYDFAVTGTDAKSQNFLDIIEVKGKVKGWVKSKNKVL